MKKFIVPATLAALLAMVGFAKASTIESDSAGNVHASFNITINPDGSISTASTGFGPFDGVEDTGFDVFNNSANGISSLTLSAPSGNDIFGFDGDGITAFVATGNVTDGSGYAGPGANFFSNITSNGTTDMGLINFAPSIAAGGTSYFSLEGPATLGDGATTVTAGTPLPTPALMGLVGIVGLGLMKKLTPKLA